MKDEYINEYDKLVEQNKLSIKIVKGLRQFRYGVGITSALGPLNRPGVQSRRNFIASASFAASIFELRPPIGRTSPLIESEPVMATSWRTGIFGPGPGFGPDRFDHHFDHSGRNFG